MNYYLEKINAAHYWLPEEGKWRVTLHIEGTFVPSNGWGRCIAITTACIDDFGTLILTKD